MSYGVYDDILTQDGFRKIGALNSRIDLEVWWHSEARIQLIVLRIGSNSTEGLIRHFVHDDEIANNEP